MLLVPTQSSFLSRTRDFAMGKVRGTLPGITSHGSEVQLVLCLEDQRLGPELQDGERLEERGNGKESNWGLVCC